MTPVVTEQPCSDRTSNAVFSTVQRAKWTVPVMRREATDVKTSPGSPAWTSANF